MAKIILNSPGISREEIEERRFFENLALSPEQRIKKMFELMALSAMFKKGPLKMPQRKGIVLTRKK